jgi:hypothetical protein
MWRVFKWVVHRVVLFSPILFACFINDVCVQILNCKFHLYAYDLQLYTVDPVRDVASLVRLVNEDLDLC